ncbi:nickel-dependent lactate racemase [Treponema sp. OMZ 840]|uniref:nickel-dependent lactate racemase n=1 Tax=Treponema sp. OMZ 840 TaxID=244313 RepID=UPI003D8B523B
MVSKVILPYAKSQIELEVDSVNLAGILVPPEIHKTYACDQESLVQKALENPIGTKRLCSLAQGKQNVVIITSDHTRAVPSKITLPLLLAEIRKGNPTAKITVLIATGLHRGMTKDEMTDRFGSDLVSKENFVNHNAYDKSLFKELGTLPSGSKCEINKIVCNADLVVAEGFIEPHFFAGFSGGRKSIFPGTASQACVNINHSAKAIAHPNSITGVLDGNPIHNDMLTAAKMAKLAFILNVLLNEKKEIVDAYCGDTDLAHRAGCTQLLSQAGVEPIKADIVITTNGGYPLDQNLYQCPKGLSSALMCAKKGAVIILVAACEDGLGGENFEKMMQEGSPQELLDRILNTPPEKTISEQWCVQRFAEALIHYRIILVSSLKESLVKAMGFLYAPTVENALQQAYAIKGQTAQVTIIPDGVSVIVKEKK